jgi:hypothetical protein
MFVHWRHVHMPSHTSTKLRKLDKSKQTFQGPSNFWDFGSFHPLTMLHMYMQENHCHTMCVAGGAVITQEAAADGSPLQDHALSCLPSMDARMYLAQPCSCELSSRLLSKTWPQGTMAI